MSEKVYRLLKYHQKLDAKLRRELKQRWPDSLKIARLKKLKLTVKDKLARAASRPKIQQA